MLITNDWAQDIHNMHTKFGVREAVAKMDKDTLKKFIEFRINFLQEELDEMKTALQSLDNNHKEDDAADITDALIDLCVVAIGTLDALQIDANLAWDKVHQANMQKEVGIKKERPNPLGLPDLIKPEGWTAPVHNDNIGLLQKLY